MDYNVALRLEKQRLGGFCFSVQAFNTLMPGGNKKFTPT